MRIFFQVGPHKVLAPESGDLITEVNLIRALSRFATVEYSGQGCDVERPDLGLRPYAGTIFPRRKYDLYYVRNNARLFTALPAPKVYFASPFHREAFGCATAIATLTDSWTAKLQTGDPSLGLYPPGYRCQRAVTLHQVLDPRFSTRQGSGRTREIRARFGEGFIIGHFGRVVESCYPHSFLHILPELRRRFPRLRVVFAGGKIDHPDIVHACFRYDEMPEALSACDLVLYNYRDHQGHFAGSMKVLEAMACGVPVLSPRYDARVEELGSDYELFHDYEPNHGRFPERVEKEMLEKMSWAIEDQGLRERVSQRLAARARHYAVSASAERLQATLRTVMESAGARPFPAPSRLTKASYLVTAPVVEAGRALRRMWRQAVKPR